MSKEIFAIRIENALQALDWADQILWDVGDAEASDEVYADGKEAPWAAAQTLICQAMCLLIDSLDGVETVTHSSEEDGPVPKRVQPYSYLSARHAATAERYIEYAHGLEDIFSDYSPPLDNKK